ncbi:unnamed protein product [Mytilus coruscus]|uniref:Uncharacterized protein n=1 Tax=Mytilus coruscus TaxID=42192 RepID=A0A6J8CD52_MYTCO|nr:unnamed protein product [Mytilus coruscus]
MPKVLYLQTFHVDFPDMNGLMSINDDICVMYNTDSRRFKYFTISGSKFITTKEIIDDSINKNPGSIFSASVKILGVTNYNGEIVLSDDTFQIRRLKTNGTFEKLSPSFTTDKLMFYGIHAANNNEILVGFTVSGGSSAGILELLDISPVIQTCKMRRVECSSNSFKTLFNLPKKITTNINRYICVIDYLNAKSGRVVAIGTWGQPKWAYNGHPSINSENEFYPNDIITTSPGLELVAAKNTNAIHVLSKDGQFICNCISSSGIIAPVSICFNKKGQLMIGCLDSGKTILHMVKLLE